MKDKRAFRAFIWMIIVACSSMIYVLSCIWLGKFIVCESIYIAGAGICGLLYLQKREKIYLREISLVFTICAIWGLQYFSGIQIQGTLFAILIIWVAFLLRYGKEK